MAVEAQAGKRRRYVPLGLRLLGIVQLVRPFNFLLFLMGTLLGGILVAGGSALQEPLGNRLLLAMISAALIGGGGNAINDVFDLKIDRVNRPDRPLPSGKITRRHAVAVWAVTSIAGFALSVFLSVYHVLIALVSIGILYVYSARFKKTPVLGNVIVSLTVALSLVYGGWAVGSPVAALSGAVFAFLTILAREIVKDIEDREGDAVLGVRSLPIVRGVGPAFSVAASIVAVTIFFTPLPYLLWQYSTTYLMAIVAANILLLLSIWHMTADDVEHATKAARTSSGYLKLAMVAGMLALAAAPLTQP